MPFEVVAIPCLSDNYAYLVRDLASGACAVVDPSEAPPVRAELARRGLTLEALWCTHHHGDHVGGVPELVDAAGARPLAVLGHEGEGERIPRLSRGLAHGARFVLGGLEVAALHVPAHTLGALAFVLYEGGLARAVFTGDTLFAAGCGRLFEGTAAMMHAALNETLGALPDACLVYPGHEYAEKNLRFARAVEPSSDAVRARLERVQAERAAGRPCVPSTLGDERATNPFLRSAVSEEVRSFALERGARAKDPVSVLAAVRAARDGF